jgi:hypothetical protein
MRWLRKAAETLGSKAGNAGDARAVTRRVVSVACSEMGDEQALGRLRGFVEDDSRVARVAAEQLLSSRDEYATDRAYRLLVAAIDGTPVGDPPDALKELFDRESELGRVPVERAFAILTELEPRLKDAWADDYAPDGRSVPAIDLARRSVKGLLGPGSENPDPLVRSNLALSVASHYVELGGDEADPDDRQASYFGARRKRVVRRLGA